MNNPYSILSEFDDWFRWEVEEYNLRNHEHLEFVMFIGGGGFAESFQPRQAIPITVKAVNCHFVQQ